MNLIQVDIIRAQSGQGFFHFRLNLLGRAVSAVIVVDIQAHFGCQDDIFTLAAFDGFADHFFGMACAIARCGVNGRDARVQRGLDGRDAQFVINFAPKVAAHTPGAQGNNGHI